MALPFMSGGLINLCKQLEIPTHYMDEINLLNILEELVKRVKQQENKNES